MQNQFVAHTKDYPFNWDKVKEELERLVETRVLAYVDEPIDWVNQIELAKDGSLQICTDPRSLNLALKREHYQLPVLEDIRSDLARAKVFNKVNLSHGYLHCVLQEDSSLLTTFSTPIWMIQVDTYLPLNCELGDLSKTNSSGTGRTCRSSLHSWWHLNLWS